MPPEDLLAIDKSLFLENAISEVVIKLTRSALLRFGL
jgi:hypothetical protein